MSASPFRWRRPIRPLRRPLDAARQLARLVTGHLLPALGRAAQRLTGRGPHGAPLTGGPDRTVLLFFEDVENDTFVRGDRHVTRALRRIYHALTKGQSVSGFEMAFRALCRALEEAGCRVVVNNVALARQNPTHPVGLCGYPHILDRWSLPNPAVLGPGLLDHPAQASRLMSDPRFRSYIVPCEWMRDLFAPYYGDDALSLWFAGFDMREWPDAREAPKDIDVLVYDKVRWERPHRAVDLLTPVLAELQRRGLRTHVVKRGAYDLAGYRATLARSRAMLFIAECETQGLAYQEAMACNVPILAWDPGLWLDPNRAQWTTEPVAASSVPFFGPACGERFADARAFPAVLDRFLARLSTYEPRRFVSDVLSLERSAALYLDAYTAAATPASPPLREPAPARAFKDAVAGADALM